MCRAQGCAAEGLLRSAGSTGPPSPLPPVFTLMLYVLLVVSQTGQPMSSLCKAEVCEGISQVLTFSSVEAIEPAVERSQSQKTCSCARCREAQDFSSIQGMNLQSSPQIAVPVINSLEFQKKFLIWALGTVILYLSKKSHFYGEILESNPFCFLLNKQYRGRESRYQVAQAGCVAGRYACTTMLYLSLTYTHRRSATESFLTYYRMCLYVSSCIFSIYVCDTDFMSCCAEETL